MNTNTADRLTMPLGEAIFTLRAIRRQKPDPIPEEDLRAVLEATIRAPNGGNEQDGGSYKVDVFDIDQGRCMYCGLCVEACPYDALHMGTDFEAATYRREDLVITMDVLKEREKHPSTWFRPQLERAKTDPYGGESQDWESVGREPFRWHPTRPAQMPEDLDPRASADGDYKSER